MRIGINLLYLLPGVVGGTEVYAAGLLEGLSLVGHGNKFIVFVNREAADWPLPQTANFTRMICPVKGSNRSRRYLFEQLCLPRLLRKHKVDLIHSLGYVGPLASPCPSIVTIPDLNYIDVAKNMRLVKRLMLRFFSKQAARRADQVITISGFSKKRLNEALRLPNDKISVTYLAPGAKVNLGGEDNWPKLARLYRIKGPYIAAFGGGALHKNIPLLIHTFAGLKDRIPHNLVLIGRVPSDVNLATASIEKGLKDRIIATDYVPSAHISTLLCHADLFVLPSLYEGFGLPVLEAQQAGVAVACSNAASLPEVAGEAAVFFNPYSIADMTEKIARVACDPVLRADLREQGLANVRRFSWERTARETMMVYERIVNSKTL